MLIVVAKIAAVSGPQLQQVGRGGKWWQRGDDAGAASIDGDVRQRLAGDPDARTTAEMLTVDEHRRLVLGHGGSSDERFLPFPGEEGRRQRHHQQEEASRRQRTSHMTSAGTIAQPRRRQQGTSAAARADHWARGYVRAE